MSDAREAAERAALEIGAEIEHRDGGGCPRFLALDTDEWRAVLAALRATRPAAEPACVSEAMMEAVVCRAIKDQGLSEVEPGQFWNSGHGFVLNAGLIARAALTAALAIDAVAENPSSNQGEARPYS